MNFCLLVYFMEFKIITDYANQLIVVILVSKIATPFHLSNLQILMSESIARLLNPILLNCKNVCNYFISLDNLLEFLDFFLI